MTVSLAHLRSSPFVCSSGYNIPYVVRRALKVRYFDSKVHWMDLLVQLLGPIKTSLESRKSMKLSPDPVISDDPRVAERRVMVPYCVPHIIVVNLPNAFLFHYTFLMSEEEESTKNLGYGYPIPY